MKKSSIKALLLFVTLQFCLLFSNAFIAYASSDISIFINNQKLMTEAPPKIVEGRTLVPLRSIFEALKINVTWDATTQTITGTKDKTIITLQINNAKAKVNDKEITISVVPQIINNRTMVPLRFISESIGASVSWEEKSASAFINYQTNTQKPFEENGIKYPSKVVGRDFLIYENEKWNKKFLKGVNIGAGKPGVFPGELAITKEEYLRWFQYISDMNADVIRVYTTLKPAFYEALYQFNENSSKPLYVMHGVWISEEDISRLHDAFGENNKIKNDLIKDAKDLVDIFHGNAKLPERPGFANGEYKFDVSKYVIGWIIGIEWDPYFVNGTNEKNPTKNFYKGKYLYTKNASPFEAFLCEVGDKVTEYEADKYKMIRPVSYSNWPTADMLSHPNEPYPDEDISEVSIENIKPDMSFAPGVFATYHIYPYYPDFMHYQKEYIQFKDDKGKINTYKAYLRDLFKEYTIPVLIGEFGIPASRGKAHESIYLGFNQGQIDESDQGYMISKLLGDIYDEGYCGGLIFAWQDEWFKRTWNTMEFDHPDMRPYWSNPQTNEQQFGLLAFDPGKEKSKCYVDGEVDDWMSETPLISSDTVKLFVKSDEKYVYLMAQTKDYDFHKDTLYIPVDTIKDQGNKGYQTGNLTFSKPADFLIKINGEDNSSILVDTYYDSFYWNYAEKQRVIEKNPEHYVKGSNVFNPMYLCLTRGFLLPEDQIKIPFTKYETGKLAYGNANPSDTEFNSLADFSFKNGNIEIRIPWLLLNVMDPSTKTIMGDLFKNKSIKGQTVDGFDIGAGIVKESSTQNMDIKMGYYSWDSWSTPTYHERLKPSYYIVKDTFKSFE